MVSFLFSLLTLIRQIVELSRNLITVLFPSTAYSIYKRETSVVFYTVQTADTQTGPTSSKTEDPAPSFFFAVSQTRRDFQYITANSLCLVCDLCLVYFSPVFSSHSRKLQEQHVKTSHCFPHRRHFHFN